MFNRGQIVRINRSKLIDSYLKKYPLMSREEAVRNHKYFFTQILDCSNGFIVYQDPPYNDTILLDPIWKDQKKYKSSLINKFIVPRECVEIDSILSISFINLSCYV